MMRNTITRTMSTSTVNAFKLSIVDGKPVVENLDPFVMSGKAKEKDALKLLKKKLGDISGITIGSIDIAEDTYEITVEDFLKHAKKVDKDSEEKVDEDSEEKVDEKVDTKN